MVLNWWYMVTFWVVHRMSSIFGNKLEINTFISNFIECSIQWKYQLNNTFVSFLFKKYFNLLEGYFMGKGEIYIHGIPGNGIHEKYILNQNISWYHFIKFREILFRKEYISNQGVFFVCLTYSYSKLEWPTFLLIRLVIHNLKRVGETSPKAGQ